jgi:hypothetical protein
MGGSEEHVTGRCSHALFGFRNRAYAECPSTATFSSSRTSVTRLTVLTLEVSELANRFRETPRRIKSALLLLKDMRRAHPTRLSGCWELQLVEDKRDDVPSSDGASLRQVG